MGSENQNVKSDEITLDDVATAIRILEIFMDRYKRAERVLSRFNTMQQRSKSLEEKIAEMMVASKQMTAGMPNVENEVPQQQDLTEEERQRIEELKKKYLPK